MARSSTFQDLAEKRRGLQNFKTLSEKMARSSTFWDLAEKNGEVFKIWRRCRTKRWAWHYFIWFPRHRCLFQQFGYVQPSFFHLVLATDSWPFPGLLSPNPRVSQTNQQSCKPCLCLYKFIMPQPQLYQTLIYTMQLTLQAKHKCDNQYKCHAYIQTNFQRCKQGKVDNQHARCILNV